MKTAITLLLCIVSLFAFGATNTVTFNLADFTSQAITNRQVKIEPRSTPRAGQTNAVLSRDSLFRYSNTNGTFILTNMSYGTYLCTLMGPYAKTEFRIYVPDTNDVFNASDLLTTASDSIETEDGLTIDLE
jgi:hypothetical protein